MTTTSAQIETLLKTVISLRASVANARSAAAQSIAADSLAATEKELAWALARPLANGETRRVRIGDRTAELFTTGYGYTAALRNADGASAWCVSSQFPGTPSVRFVGAVLAYAAGRAS